MPSDLVVLKDRMTGVEASARAMYHLGRGEIMTPALVAAMTGLSRQHANRLLCAMSRVVPIYRNGGGWHICRPDDIDRIQEEDAMKTKPGPKNRVCPEEPRAVIRVVVPESLKAHIEETAGRGTISGRALDLILLGIIAEAEAKMRAVA